MSKIKRGRLALAAVSAGAAVSGVGLMAPPASAAGTFTVDNTPGSGCSDAAGPTYCSITAAMNLAQPGDVVNVLKGTYGQVTVTKAITLKGNGQAVITNAANGFVINGVSNVTVDGFTVQNTSGAGFLLGDHKGKPTGHTTTNNLVITNNVVTGSGGGVPGTAGVIATPGFDSDYVTNSRFADNRADKNNDYGFYFTNGSDYNVLEHNEASGNVNPAVRRANGIDIVTKHNTVDGNVLHDNQDSGLQFYSGGDYNTATNNVSYHNGDHGIDDLNVTGGVLLNNTSYDNCTAGINVEGTSTAYTVEDNISMNNGTNTGCAHGPAGADGSGQGGQVRIADSAILDTATVADYNLVFNNANTSPLVPVSNSRGTAPHDILGRNPGFANAAGGDFSIGAASPAVGASDPNLLSGPSNDIRGYNRPTVASVGAYEGAPATTSPVASAVITGPNPGYAPNAVVNVNASGSSKGTAGSLNYSIDFDSTHVAGSSTPITTVSGQHTYPTPGTYLIAVTVTDAADATRTSTHTYPVTVTAKPATPVLTVTPSTGTAPVTVTASGAGTTAGGNAIAKYIFDFGDNNPVTVNAGGAWPTHVYANGGTYNVMMTVVDTAGVSSVTATQQIVLAGTPAPPVTGGPGTGPGTGNATGGPTVNQIGGPDRYATGLLVSQHRWQAGQANAVVIATGKNFADALAGVPLATKVGGPLLLVDGASAKMDPAVASEISRVLKPGGTVYVLGGTAAVSQGIENQIKASHPVTRYKGNDRYQTSVDIAVRGLGSPAHAVVATGNGFADALASGPFATGPFADAAGRPAAILLSNDKVLDPTVAGYLASKSSGNIATIGHQAAAAVPRAGTSYAGATRFDTDAQVAGAFVGASAGNQVGVADGLNFPDALTGGAYMASLATPGPVVLVDGLDKTVPGQATAVLDGRRGNVEADVFGGPAVITATMSGVIVQHLAASTVNHIGF